MRYPRRGATMRWLRGLTQLVRNVSALVSRLAFGDASPFGQLGFVFGNATNTVNITAGGGHSGA